MKPASDLDRILEAFRETNALLRQIGGKLDAGITIHVVHQPDAATAAKLDTIIQQGAIMAGELAKLTQEVSEARTVMASAKVLLIGLKAALDGAIASGDPAALTALSDSLDTGGNDLAAAILANTPAPPVSAVIALPQGVVGAPYSGALPSITGTAPFSHTVTLGNLPDGLALDLTSGALLGTPERIGSFAFTVASTDVDPETADQLRSFTVEVV